MRYLFATLLIMMQVFRVVTPFVVRSAIPNVGMRANEAQYR